MAASGVLEQLLCGNLEYANNPLLKELAQAVKHRLRDTIFKEALELNFFTTTTTGDRVCVIPDLGNRTVCVAASPTAPVTRILTPFGRTEIVTTGFERVRNGAGEPTPARQKKKPGKSARKGLRLGYGKSTLQYGGEAESGLPLHVRIPPGGVGRNKREYRNRHKRLRKLAMRMASASASSAPTTAPDDSDTKDLYLWECGRPVDRTAEYGSDVLDKLEQKIHEKDGRIKLCTRGVFDAEHSLETKRCGQGYHSLKMALLALRNVEQTGTERVSISGGVAKRVRLCPDWLTGLPCDGHTAFADHQHNVLMLVAAAQKIYDQASVRKKADFALLIEAEPRLSNRLLFWPFPEPKEVADQGRKIAAANIFARWSD